MKPLHPSINEKKIIFHFSFLIFCVCLLWPDTLKAQEKVEDIKETHTMSHEKADSLLISLSKGTLNDANEQLVLDNDTLDTNKLVLDNDTIDTNTIETEWPEEETIQSDGSNSDNPEIVRKKAAVEKNDRIIKQATRKKLLKDEDDVDYRDLRSINEGTLIGVGGYMMKDTYLSNEKYGGVGLRFMNERMRLTNLANKKISRQNIVNVDISSTMNGARNANFLSAFVDYSYGLHYRFNPDPFFKILVGGSARGMIGMVYNTRNGNNPLTVHADIDLNVSLIAIYEFRIKRAPFAVRYQLESPFMGILFSPEYMQSYYEIFSLGNTAEIYKFNSLSNKFAMRNYLTLDFPVGSTTIRVGYFGLFYKTKINEIDRFIISNNVMIGLVKEFVAFGGREMRRRNLFNSAYY